MEGRQRGAHRPSEAGAEVDPLAFTGVAGTRGRLHGRIGGGGAADGRSVGPESVARDRVLGDGHARPKAARVSEQVRREGGGGRCHRETAGADEGGTVGRGDGARLREAEGSEGVASGGVVEALLASRGPHLLTLAREASSGSHGRPGGSSGFRRLGSC